MPHWLVGLLAWHRANVLGNVVASFELGVLAVAAYPLWRRWWLRLRRRWTAQLKTHLSAQVQREVGPLHLRLDQLVERIVDPDDNEEKK